MHYITMMSVIDSLDETEGYKEPHNDKKNGYKMYLKKVPNNNKIICMKTEFESV